MNEKHIQVLSTKPLDESTTYTIKGKVFLVESKFQDQGSETLNDVLMRLIKSEIADP